MIPIAAPSPRQRLIRSFARVAWTLLLAVAVAATPGEAQAPSDPGTEAELEEQAGPKKHRKRQSRPVRMGTSGGNVEDFDGRVCCSGTLGGLVRKDDRYFVLSNNHVIAQINKASVGDDVNQPGLIDLNCDVRERDFVAELSGYKKLRMRGRNTVDAAIAEVVDGTVDESGEILGIGVPGTEPVEPRVGMEVQKSGRTTGVRKGVIDMVNVSGFVTFPEECSLDARELDIFFVKQFSVVAAGRKSFSAGGDSGSVILEDRKDCPNPVGLLFAGNERITVGNSFNRVLKAVDKMKPKGKAELVGCNQSSGGSLWTKGGVPGIEDRRMRLAERVQARTESELFKLEGVHAMGIGRSASRPTDPVFKVYLDPEHSETTRFIPRQLGNIPVEVVETEPLRALSCARAELQVR